MSTKKPDITREPKPPPFPLGTRLVCVSERGDITTKSWRDGAWVESLVYGKGLEVVIDEVIEGRQGTGQQLRDHDGLMFYEDTGDPILDETEDGMSSYHVTSKDGTRDSGRLIRHDNISEWKVVAAAAKPRKRGKRDAS